MANADIREEMTLFRRRLRVKGAPKKPHSLGMSQLLPPRGPITDGRRGQLSKYSANSYGWGRSRTASSSFSRLYSIQVEITSDVNTSPFKRNP